MYIATQKEKKIGMLALTVLTIALLTTTLFSGCTTSQTNEGLPIVIIGRDSTSGTREFFFEHVMNKENFSSNLQEKNSNCGVYQAVTQTPGAVGYVGLGYVDSGVKAIPIDGIAPTVANILAGTYPISRELYMFTKGQATGIAKEFIEYIQSTEGQAIVEQEGFVPLAGTKPYNSTGKTLIGDLQLGGSTTVFPIAEQAKDSFMAIYPDVTVTVSSTGSGAGITAVSQGTVDIGMASRDLQASESNLGLVKHVVAKDGIAVIVNPTNTYVTGLTLAQVKSIYKGEITNWMDV
jgi:phosphate transport system substrate-binding protein